MYRHSLRPFPVLFILIFVLSSTAFVVLAHSASPRGLRISRVGNRMIASWSHPAGVDSATYFLRRNLRFAGEGWTGWSSSDTVTGTSSAVLTITGSGVFDIRVIVELFAHGSFHSATAKLCGVNAGSSSSGGGSCGGGGGGGSSAASIATRPVAHTCKTLSSAQNGVTITSSTGLESGIQCQQLDGPGIGIASIVEAGFTSAVDVWGTVKDAQVCFENASGSLLFLDAANTPRTAAPIESVTEDGKVCATIDRQGSLVLVPVSDADTAQEGEQAAAVPGASVYCEVTTITFVNLRGSPGGDYVLFIIRPGVTMRAWARMGDWFRVRLLDTDGWTSARYVVSAGDCG